VNTLHLHCGELSFSGLLQVLVGSLFTVTGRTNCGLSLAGRKLQLIVSYHSTLILLRRIEASYDTLYLLIIELRFLRDVVL